MRVKRLTAGLLVGGVAAAGLLALAPATAGAGVSSGHLVMIGGNLSENRAILRRIVKLADPDGDGPAVPRVALVTAAAPQAKSKKAASNINKDNSAANGLYYGDLFQQFGATTYRVRIDGAVNYKGDTYIPANAYSKEVAAKVAAADAVFFGGGDQMKYVRTLLDCEDAPKEAFVSCVDTPVLSAIREVADGGVIAGVSAGTTIQNGSNMVTGGESYEGWRDGAFAGYYSNPRKLAYVPYGGFGFFDAGLVDSHFDTWGRQARMIRLAATVDAPRIVGVDETTALVYDRSTRTGRVIGEHGVSIIDVKGATIEGTKASGVKWTYLAHGDRFAFDTGTVYPSVKPTMAPGSADAPSRVKDMWDSIDGPGNVYSMRNAGRALVRSEGSSVVGVTYEDGPRFRTVLSRAEGTQWWRGEHGVGFSDLEISIRAS